MTGLVYKSTGSWYTVKTDLGAIYQCRIKGKFRMKDIKSTNPIAVGDLVDFELETKNDETTGIINTRFMIVKIILYANRLNYQNKPILLHQISIRYFY